MLVTAGRSPAAPSSEDLGYGLREPLSGEAFAGSSPSIERIRITGQLIDASTGNHLWAERYERELKDLFAVQDEVREAIVAAIAPEISDVELVRLRQKVALGGCE